MLNEFQFQYGAIKRENSQDAIFVNVMFQFQYGAIKSQKAWTKAIDIASFNSNMVRLKALYLKSNTGVINMFQFQYGAIKRIV